MAATGTRRRPRWPRSPATFCVLLALLLVATRVAIVDHRILSVSILPLHDMYEGATFFATSMHSVRLTGEIAWWNPISSFGYAQYYQSFLAPMAPTSGHPVFVLWSALIAGLARLDVAIPEYRQYLVVNYLVLPFLCFLAFGAFCWVVFRDRVTVVLAAIVYAFSGLGLWNSAWFYFQEAGTAFFLLAAFIAAHQRPTAPRLLMLALAVVVQIASFNYWTLYNSWFLTAVLGGYVCIYRTQTRRLGRRARAVARRHPVWTGVTAAAVVGTIITWSLLLLLIVRDQGGHYVRLTGPFSVTDAFRRIPTLHIFAAGLFNPSLDLGAGTYADVNPMHGARYLGATLFPLLVLLFVQPWGRQERWLVASTVAILIVCLGPPLLLDAWAVLPGLHRIRHLFYFYTHHLQLLLALLAAASLRNVVARDQAPGRRRVLARVAGGATVVFGLVLVEVTALVALLPGESPLVVGGLGFAATAGVAAVVLFRFLRWPTAAARAVLVAVLLSFTAADLTRYFWVIERADEGFTSNGRFADPVPDPLPPAARAAFQRIWPLPALAEGFNGGLAPTMPVRSDIWPNNTYLIDARLVERLAALFVDGTGRMSEGLALIATIPPDDPAARLRQLRFFPAGRVTTLRGEWLDFAGGDPEVLRLDADVPPTASRASDNGTFWYRFVEWSYNRFRIAVVTPVSGWLFVPQVFDAAWVVEVDGTPVTAARAEHAFLAVPVPRGAHAVVLDYRPRVRALYGPAKVLLIATCCLLLALAVAAWRRPASGRVPATDRAD